MTRATFPPGHPVYDVQNDISLMVMGGKVMVFEFFPFVDFTIPYYIFHMVVAAIHPQQLSSHNNILQAFNSLIWIITYISLLSVCVAFSIIYYVYHYEIPHYGLVKPIGWVEWVDFLILPFSKCLAPEPFRWFPARASAGQVLIQFWSIFTMFLVFFYNSNLQADLVRKSYEKPMSTLQDVLDRNVPIYIPQGLAALDYKAAAAQGVPISDIMVKLSKQGYKTNGYYDILESHGSFSRDKWENVVSHRATYLQLDGAVLYEYLYNKTFGGLPHIQYTKEVITTEMFCFYMKKYSPMKAEVDFTLGRMIDSGIMQKILFEPAPIEATIKWNPASEGNDNEPLQLNQLLLAFYALIALCMFSGLVFMVEAMFDKITWYVEDVTFDCYMESSEGIFDRSLESN